MHHVGSERHGETNSRGRCGPQMAEEDAINPALL
eukprot:COSAG01_NODE_47195_length_392_cov_5.450512_2_plen_33_part_01